MEDIVKFDQELTDLLEESRSEIENSFNTRTDVEAESAKPTQNQKPKGCEEKGASFLVDDLAEKEGPNNLQEINPPSNETDGPLEQMKTVENASHQPGLGQEECGSRCQRPPQLAPSLSVDIDALLMAMPEKKDSPESKAEEVCGQKGDANLEDSNNRGDSVAMESTKHATVNIIAPDAECVPEEEDTGLSQKRRRMIERQSSKMLDLADSIPKLEEVTDYFSWETGLKKAAEQLQALSHLQGSDRCPSDRTSEEYRSWAVKEKMLNHLVSHSLGESFATKVLHEGLVSQKYRAIQNFYYTKSTRKLLDLEEKLMYLTLESRSILQLAKLLKGFYHAMDAAGQARTDGQKARDMIRICREDPRYNAVCNDLLDLEVQECTFIKCCNALQHHKTPTITPPRRKTVNLSDDSVRYVIKHYGGRISTKDLWRIFQKQVKASPINKQKFKVIVHKISDIVEDAIEGKMVVLKPRYL